MFNINGKTIESFKGKLLDREVSSNEVITINDWLDGAINPTFIRQQEKFKDIKVKVLIEGADENDAYLQFSRLTAELKYGTLKFNDMALSFAVQINGLVSPKRLKPNVFEVEYSLKSGYGMGQEQVVNRATGAPATFSINNAGTAETPCIIEITPTTSFALLTLEGFTDKPANIKNLVSGQKIVIDGERNAITVNGQNNFSNYDAWSFPSLLPGANNLKVNTSVGYTMVIKYKARYI